MPGAPEFGKCLLFSWLRFLFTTAALEGPTGEGGELARRRNSFPPKTPPSSVAVVGISFFPYQCYMRDSVADINGANLGGLGELLTSFSSISYS